jgi:zinc transport system substrate-binding protein
MNKRKTAIAAVFVAFVTAVIVSVCFFANNHHNGKMVVTTNFVAYDFARAVIGDASEVKMLLKPGAETHDFEPTPQDIKEIADADFFIYTGGESDEWVEKILSDNNISTSKTIKMFDYVDLIKEDGDEDEYDEHIWTNPLNAIRIVNGIRDRLVAKNPTKYDEYAGNAQKFTETIKDIDAQFRNIINSAQRKELVFADRFPFRYFVEEYGLSYVAAFPGCSDQTEASSSTIALLVDKVKTDQLPAVLKIELTSDKLAKTISDETGAKILTLNAAHNISQEDFDNGTTYADIMSRNLSVIREALN